MTQLTPEELAACQEARRFWNHETLDPDLPSHMFSAGLAHARAESAKEIADLNDSLSLAQTHVANLLIVESRLRDKIETLKAQVEGMDKELKIVHEALTELYNIDSAVPTIKNALKAIAQEKSK